VLFLVALLLVTSLCLAQERLVNSLMMHGRNNGKKMMAVRIVKHVSISRLLCIIIELRFVLVAFGRRSRSSTCRRT
jgi:hypothetical protein